MICSVVLYGHSCVQFLIVLFAQVLSFSWLQRAGFKIFTYEACPPVC
uniref:Uncharacterized protein n=1 Tax=Arundo donax TaxID=35708 RepID=A0A0A9B8I7_ARUDO